MMVVEMLPVKNMRKSMDAKPKLFLVRGLPGSGKSTAAATQENWNHRVLESDMFMLNSEGEYEFDPTKLSWVHDQCYNKTVEFLEQGFDVSVANTFTQMWELERYLAIPNVDIFVVEMKTQFQNVHGVPDAKLEVMRARWEELPEDFPYPVTRITSDKYVEH